MYDIAYLIRGKLRKKILELLDQPKTATILSKEVNKHRSSISRILLNLEKRKLVKCKNPKDKMYRFYIITNKGKEILDKVKKLI